MAVEKEGKSGQHQGSVQLKRSQTIKPGEGSRGRTKRTLKAKAGTRDTKS